MIVIAGHMTMDPANVEQARAAMAAVMEATAAAEPGCVTYRFSPHLTEPGRFDIFEEWESQEALDAHFSQPHMATFIGQLGGLGVTGSEIAKYEVSAKGPLH